YRNEQRRAEAEAALRASLERFDMAVKGSQDGIWDAWAVSTDYFHPDNPVYYSPRFKELLGYEDEEFPNVVGSWISHLYPEDRDCAIHALVDHLQHRVPYNIEYRMFTKSGEVRWFAGRGQAIWDDHGRPIRISGSFRDITDRKRTEEALQEANRQLRALDRLRTQFFADISHELRTPLTVIRGEAEVTLRGGIKPVHEYRATLERIVELTKDVNTLVEDLLFLARTEAGSIQLQRDRLHFQSLVQECAQAGGILAQRKTLTWSVALRAPEAVVTGDPHRLKQALMIVIDNAVKYTEPGGTLTLDLLAHASWVEFTLTDTGIGIHPDDLPHVFERFYRVTRHHMDILSGAGLGLPIAKWIIDAHGGSIDIQSEFQKGTSVRIRLPLTEDEHTGEHDAHFVD
ncbi:MAG: PAS domain S-box protein, partial [Nitrospirae bacterium]